MSMPSHHISRERASYRLNNNDEVAQRVWDGSQPLLDESNSTSTPLTSTQTSFTGPWVISESADIVIAITSDKECTFGAQFSPDGVNIDSTLSFKFEAGVIEQPKRISVTRKYYRTFCYNTSSENMTYLRFQTRQGKFTELNTPLNAMIGADNGATVTRSINLEDEVSLGRYYAVSVVHDFGENNDVDATGNEDIVETGGLYTGFPVGNPDTLMIALSNAADVGKIVTLSFMSTETSTQFTKRDFTVTSQEFNTGVTAYRCNNVIFNSGGSNLLNQGTIAVYHRNTSGNTFALVQALKGESRMTCDTIPSNSSALIKKIFASINRTNTATVTGALWIRQFGKSPRLVRPFTITNAIDYEDNIFGGYLIPGPADISLRVETCSANNVDVYGSIDYLLYKNN